METNLQIVLYIGNIYPIGIPQIAFRITYLPDSNPEKPLYTSESKKKGVGTPAREERRRRYQSQRGVPIANRFGRSGLQLTRSIGGTKELSSAVAEGR